MKGHRFTSRFKKDIRRASNQGRDVSRIMEIVVILVSGEQPDPKLKDHSLTGNWKGFRELHLAPDWLLIYRIDGETLILERTGSHSELF